MRTYYRGPDAHVTDERFTWRAATPRVFAVRELRDVVLTRRLDPDRRPDVALMAAALLAVLAAITVGLVGLVVGAALGLVAVIVAGVAFATRRHRPAYLRQLRATYRGVQVLVYESPDERVFNQVKRALCRALEDNPPTGAEVSLVAA